MASIKRQLTVRLICDLADAASSTHFENRLKEISPTYIRLSNALCTLSSFFMERLEAEKEDPRIDIRIIDILRRKLDPLAIAFTEYFVHIPEISTSALLPLFALQDMVKSLQCLVDCMQYHQDLNDLRICLHKLLLVLNIDLIKYRSLYDLERTLNIKLIAPDVALVSDMQELRWISKAGSYSPARLLLLTNRLIIVTSKHCVILDCALESIWIHPRPPYIISFIHLVSHSTTILAQQRPIQVVTLLVPNYKNSKLTIEVPQIISKIQSLVDSLDLHVRERVVKEWKNIGSGSKKDALRELARRITTNSIVLQCDEEEDGESI